MGSHGKGHRLKGGKMVSRGSASKILLWCLLFDVDFCLGATTVRKRFFSKSDVELMQQESFWASVVESAMSYPSGQPTIRPTDSPTYLSSSPSVSPTAPPTLTLDTSPPSPSPSEGTSATPSETPTTKPSQRPSPTPTRAPTTNPSLTPTENPTSRPSKLPTGMPSPEPTVAPVPTESPAAPPTGFPTLVPTVVPTMTITTAPTSVCVADLSMSCTAGGLGNIPCTSLVAESELLCACMECAREAVFVYTANPCEGVSDCVDVSAEGPPSNAILQITDLDDAGTVLFSGSVALGTEIQISGLSGECLPDSFAVSVTDEGTGELSQILALESWCGVDGLSLRDSSGAIDFMGYSCDETDVHNCFIDVLYDFDSCNTGNTNMTLRTLLFELNGNTSDLLVSGIPTGGLMLGPSECYSTSVTSTVDVCSSEDYAAESMLTAATDTGGALCTDNDHLDFGWDAVTYAPSTSPSMMPSATPSLSPTQSPSVAPTPVPSAMPTDVCDISVNLQCITTTDPRDCALIEQESEPLCRCDECARELVFVYNGGTCEDSTGSTADCVDYLGPRSIARLVIVDGSDATNILFDGSVQTGRQVTISNSDACLPVQLVATTTAIDDETAILQSVTIDTTCDGRDSPELLRSYGALDFGGYSCSDDDVHNCNVDVAYLFSTCNVDTEQVLRLYDFDFTLNGTVVDVLGNDSPLSLAPTGCFSSFFVSVFERCVPRTYASSVFVNASFVATGPFCSDTNVLLFDTNIDSLSPTASPSLVNSTEAITLELEGKSSVQTETTGTCPVVANLTCEVIGETAKKSCEEIAIPSEPSCNGDLRALRMLYSGSRCQKGTAGCFDYTSNNLATWDEVWVTVLDGTTSKYWEGTVREGDTIDIVLDDSVFSGNWFLLEVRQEEGADAVMQTVLMDTQCIGISKPLALGHAYGAWALISHTDASLGVQNLFEEVSVSYMVYNAESDAFLVDSAIVSSSLGYFGEEAIGSEESVEVTSQGSATIWSMNRVVNLQEYANYTFVFALELTGHSVSDLGSKCLEQCTYSFEVGESL
eukprot:Nitzschia sp. Nitz4//scaffold66_size103028//76674//79817//NITZ4_004508-RA/size103028-processed-gene-0.123-mRNA-1//-1//CDS//3329556380//7205//frame0